MLVLKIVVCVSSSYTSVDLKRSEVLDHPELYKSVMIFFQIGPQCDRAIAWLHTLCKPHKNNSAIHTEPVLTFNEESV